MRKDELLYLHQLLATARRDLEERGDLPADAVSAYDDEVSVSPVAAYAQKGDHEVAVRTLAAELAVATDEQGTDRRHRAISQ